MMATRQNENAPVCAMLFAALLLAACATRLSDAPATTPPAPIALPAPDAETALPFPASPSVEISRSTSVSAHCIFGCPGSAPRGNRLVQHRLYTLSNNGERRFADWVAYIVTTRNIGPDRPRNFEADIAVPEDETLEPPDYDHAYARYRYDQGHQAPLNSFGASPDWQETNLLSNITPQHRNLNRGRWSRLEEAERRLAHRTRVSVFVVTGPLYEANMHSLPGADEDHIVPSGFWKVIATNDGLAAAFVFDNAPANERYCGGQRSISEVERRSGLNLFPDVTLNSLGNLAEALGCAPPRH